MGCWCIVDVGNIQRKRRTRREPACVGGLEHYIEHAHVTVSRCAAEGLSSGVEGQPRWQRCSVRHRCIVSQRIAVDEVHIVEYPIPNGKAERCILRSRLVSQGHTYSRRIVYIQHVQRKVAGGVIAIHVGCSNCHFQRANIVVARRTGEFARCAVKSQPCGEIATIRQCGCIGNGGG